MKLPPMRDNPELLRLLAESVARVNAMTPEERAAMREAQRQSWVRGEMGMGSDRDEAEYARKLRENRG